MDRSDEVDCNIVFPVTGYSNLNVPKDAHGRDGDGTLNLTLKVLIRDDQAKHRMKHRDFIAVYAVMTNGKVECKS